MDGKRAWLSVLFSRNVALALLRSNTHLISAASKLAQESNILVLNFFNHFYQTTQYYPLHNFTDFIKVDTEGESYKNVCHEI